MLLIFLIPGLISNTISVLGVNDVPSVVLTCSRMVCLPRDRSLLLMTYGNVPAGKETDNKINVDIVTVSIYNLLKITN